MPVLVDTNILIAMRNPENRDHRVCNQVFQASLAPADNLCICCQVLIEYWVVATRPKRSGGIGLSPAETEVDIDALRRILPCLQEPPDIIALWQPLVVKYAVSGVLAHDAHMVAVMDYHKIDRILTLNTSDFTRFTHIKCLTPSELLGG
jgi:predicted nucleic acid-binding protein